jgi:hypothetical protein
MDNLVSHVQSVLKTTPTRWRSLVELISPELLNRHPDPAEWSAMECLQHLVDLERWVFPVRVKAFLAGEPIPAFDPDKQGSKWSADQSPLKLVEELEKLRADSIALLDTVSESDLGRQIVHSQLGPVTLGEMLHEWAGHDLMHTVQAEQAMMQPFIQGCGAWKPFFDKYVVVG